MSGDRICAHCDKVFKWGSDNDSFYAVWAADKTCAQNAHWKLQGHMTIDHPTEGYICPRRSETPMVQARGNDFWSKDTESGYRRCSCCGSMHPDDLFEMIEKKTCEISGTDKNYKIYVDAPHPHVGAPRIFSSCSHPSHGYEKLTEDRAKQAGLDSYAIHAHLGGYVKIDRQGPRANLKFYYMHLSDEQRNRFIELYNSRQLPLEPQFGLYRTPYFATKVIKGDST